MPAALPPPKPGTGRKGQEDGAGGKGSRKDAKQAQPGDVQGGDGKGPSEDFRLGEFRCLRCGAAFSDRVGLDRHTERGHALQA